MNLIFDFDGTIIDSFHCVVKKFALLADEFNLRKVDEHEINELRHLTSREIIKYLRIPIYKIPFIVYQIRKYLHDEMSKLAPVTNMPQVLKKLHEAGFFLGILTSNSQENVELWLEFYHMQHFFNFVHMESSFWRKKHILKKTLKEYKMDQTQTFYIGDETRDIEAAKQCNIYSVAVTWGYNSEEVLLQCQPHYIVYKPEDLLTLLCVE
jgi:phosphoglycolate phosphatase